LHTTRSSTLLGETSFYRRPNPFKAMFDFILTTLVVALKVL